MCRAAPVGRGVRVCDVYVVCMLCVLCVCPHPRTGMHTRVPVCVCVCPWACECRVPCARVPVTAPVPAPGLPRLPVPPGALQVPMSGFGTLPSGRSCPYLDISPRPINSGGPGPTPPPPRPSPLRYRPRCPLPAPVPALFPAMSSSQFNKGPSYGLSAEVKNRVSRGGDRAVSGPPDWGGAGAGGYRGHRALWLPVLLEARESRASWCC